MQNTDDKILNNLTDDEVIDLFIKGIMQEKGSNVGSEQMQEDIFNELRAELLEQMDRSLIGALPEDKLNELNEIATSGKIIEPERIADMIKQANLDVQDILGNTMARFREIYLGQANQDQDQTQGTDLNITHEREKSSESGGESHAQ